MSTFADIIETLNPEEIKADIYSKTSADVERALAKERRNLEDFKALISPAAIPYLEKMAQISNAMTLKRFGKTMQLYIPMYMSNLCENKCIYCGFNNSNHIKRIILKPEEILQEGLIIKEMGFEHLLLVTGENSRVCGVDYLKEAIRVLRPHFAQISMEVQPLLQEEYKTLCDEGLHSVYIYQETYNKEKYPIYHPQGRKADYKYRIETPDRLGAAGIHKIGLGVLIGLDDWRLDSFMLASHLRYLEKKYWKTRYSVSFPRIRPHAGSFISDVIMTDKELVQLICAYRLVNPDIEMALSTRESESFRNNVMPLGVTSMSAGSKTNPGGYAASEEESLEQFTIADDRSADEIANLIRSKGYEPVWKDWDACYLSPNN